ncbi:MAG: glycosyltransferase [Bryobacterales bacterium]|nr:glycosyltransferase [Bryobacterales bacterium]
MPPKVSIVTPSFNQGRFIERTVSSVLSQGVPDLEYRVVDGGSTDETCRILERYGSSIHWVSEKDNGQADAVNKGLRACSGEVFGWLNSDDIYYPGAVAAAAGYFEANPDIDVVYGDANHIDEQDRVIEPYPTEPWDFERLTRACFICQPAVFFRRRVVERHGFLDAGLRYTMDYEYWIRLGRAGARFGWLRRTLAGSRLHADTKTLGARVPVHAEINSMLRRGLGRVPDRWLSNYAHVVLDARGVARGTLGFSLLVSLLSWYAALKWNRRISGPMWRETAQWIAGNARAAFRRISA